MLSNSLEDSNRKPNKIQVDKGREFYEKSMKPWLEKITRKCIQHTMK